MTKNFFTVFLLSLLFASLAPLAADPSLSLCASLPKEHYLIGEPIYLYYTLANTGQKPVNICISPAGDEGEEIAGLRVEVRDVRGDPDVSPPCSVPRESGLIVYGSGGEPTTKTLLPGERVIHSYRWLFLDCPLSDVKPGTYEARVRMKVLGKKLSTTIWQGDIASENVRFTLTEPQGEDKAYIEDLLAYLKSGKIKRAPLSTNPLRADEVTYIRAMPVIEAHLSSIYTACVIYRMIGGWAFADPQIAFRLLETGRFGYAGALPSADGVNGLSTATREECLQWSLKWIETTLKYHPDFVMADDIRLTRALDQIALKNYQAGAADLEQLCSSARPDVAEKANQYLGLIKQKGWIK